MKKLLLIALFLLSFLAPIYAQDPPSQEMSPQEAEQLMNSIGEKMRQLEQMLAKASLEPEDLSTLIEQLKLAAEDKDFDHLPRTLREFLLNNPDLLAKLKNPDAEGDSLLATEDEIRRLLATEDDGLAQLLRQNPEMLERLLSQEDAMGDALRAHNEAENNLRRLFDETSRQMESTEGDIQRLMELAEQMQQQMNQQAQGNQNQPNQPQDESQPGERRPDNQNDSVEDPQGQDQNPEGSPESGTPRAGSGQNDPDAWELFLPRSERERGSDTSRNAAPRRWKAETARYFRLLAEQARREREREESRRREREREGR